MQHPAAGSKAPNARAPMRKLSIAPVHIAHGSSVTYKIQSESHFLPVISAAFFKTNISA